MISMIAWSVVDCGFEPLLGQTKDYKINIYCFSAKYTVRTKTGWLRIRIMLSEWSDMLIRGLLFQ
jgi:hypothetical protein